MEALLPLIVAVLLAETGSKMQRSTAILARHYGGSGKILFSLMLTSLVGLLVAGFAGAYVVPMLNFQAKNMLLGLALVFSAFGVALPRGVKTHVISGPPLVNCLWRYTLAQLGDNAQFLVFAFAARSDAPMLAGLAGVAGVVVAALPAWFAPSEYERIVRGWMLRLAVSALLTVAGLFSLLSAWKLL